VLYWDLYNTAGNAGLWEESLPLLDQTFQWARDVDPVQPLAVAAWREFGGAMAARKLESSDLITFQSFDNVESLEARLQLLQRYNRPIICSDWLMRQVGNDFEKVLPLFSPPTGWAGSTRGWSAAKPIARSRMRATGWKRIPMSGSRMFAERWNSLCEREIELIQGFQFLDTP
jgi:hypothetical protein